MDEQGTPERAVADALAAITDAYQRAAAAIEPLEDDQRALTLAGKLAEGIRESYEQAAQLRIVRVRRIWDAEDLSLSGLAERVGWSKSRAAQVVKRFAGTSPAGEGES
jgi:hypothetical protein